MTAKKLHHAWVFSHCKHPCFQWTDTHNTHTCKLIVLMQEMRYPLGPSGRKRVIIFVPVIPELQIIRGIDSASRC